MILVMVLLGGSGLIYGPLGAFLMTGFNEVLRPLSSTHAHHRRPDDGVMFLKPRGLLGRE